MKFGDLKIPHKLMAVFAVMLAAIAVMGVTLFINQMDYEGSVDRTERAYESLRAADTAAFRLTRQENSLRGFLLSGDLEVTKKMLALEPGLPGDVSPQDKLKDVVQGEVGGEDDFE